MYWVGGDKSVLGGVFLIMEFFPDPLLAEQPGDIQLKILGESHAEMHNHSTASIINELKKYGLEENQFIASLIVPSLLDSAQSEHPWLSNIINWLRNIYPSRQPKRASITETITPEILCTLQSILPALLTGIFL